MISVLGAVLVSPITSFLRSRNEVLEDTNSSVGSAAEDVEIEAPQVLATVIESSNHVEVVGDLSPITENEYSFTELEDMSSDLVDIARGLGVVHGLPCFEKLGDLDPKIDYVIALEVDELEGKLLSNPIFLNHFGEPAHVWDLDLIQMWRKGDQTELARVKSSPQTLVWYTPDVESPVLEVFLIDSKNYRKVKAIRDRIRNSYTPSRKALVEEQKRLEQKYTKKATSEVYE